MRISDWSSDVCSSDLAKPRLAAGGMLLRGQPEPCGELSSRAELIGIGDGRGDGRCRDHTQARDRCKLATGLALGMPGDELLVEHRNLAADAHDLTDQYLQSRSEEHTSELQSLMRTSYAVFCLQKKN